MNARAFRTCALAAAILLPCTAAPVNAQKQITEEYLDLVIRAFSTEQTELQNVGPQIAEIDEKITKFEECKELYEAAGGATGSRLGGFAAKAAMRAKCGATDTDGFHKDKQKILQGPEKAALSILSMKAGEYGKLKEKMQTYLQNGSGFKADEAALLSARRTDIASAMGIDLSLLAAAGRTSGGGNNGAARTGRGMRNAWTPDYAWSYIGDMFAMMYISGATIFEKPYEAGQWTTWEIVARDTRHNDDQRPDAELESKRVIERAFLGSSDDGSEWWRTTSIDFYDDNGTQKADTVILESLFRAENEYVRQLVRIRAKLPGQEPSEMMVPQHFAMLSLLSAFPMKPTEESVKGATVGTERVGSFDAQQVRFASGDGGNIEWWLADTAPGGWVRFRHTDPREDDVRQPGTYTIQMVNSGTGAKSQLGVM